MSKASTYRGLNRTRYVPPSPFLTAMAVYSALPRPRIIAPGFTRGVLALQGNSRTEESDFVSEITVPHGVDSTTTASNSGLRRVVSLHLQDSLRQFDRNHLLQVSLQ